MIQKNNKNFHLIHANEFNVHNFKLQNLEKKFKILFISIIKNLMKIILLLSFLKNIL